MLVDVAATEGDALVEAVGDNDGAVLASGDGEELTLGVTDVVAFTLGVMLALGEALLVELVLGFGVADGLSEGLEMLSRILSTSLSTRYMHVVPVRTAIMYRMFPNSGMLNISGCPLKTFFTIDMSLSVLSSKKKKVSSLKNHRFAPQIRAESDSEM